MPWLAGEELVTHLVWPHNDIRLGSYNGEDSPGDISRVRQSRRLC